jgi:serine/threonine protein phosphatase 1
MAVYTVSDLHGNYILWEQIKEFLKEGDTLIFLGDAIDRGDRGFEIFMEMLDHPQVVFLKGNHEDMMYEAFHDIGPDRGKMLKHWTKKDNGGQETLDNLKSLELDYETKMEYINTIARLPYYAEYENDDGIKFILCHAGYTPGRLWDDTTPWKKEEKMLWDRNHFVNPNSWPVDEPTYDNVVMVHGHTPILLMKQWGFDASGLAPLWYDGNHKVNIDAATPSTGLALLLNLDTYDYELFTDGSIYKYTEGDE